MNERLCAKRGTKIILFLPTKDDTDVDARILNVSFSAKRPDLAEETFYPLQFLRERVYLQRGTLASLATVQVRTSWLRSTLSFSFS